ncbi:MAG: hypothetical protein ACI83D_000179 [Planctomycetota bacterium]|jgi:hypothetical protein
MYDKNEITYFGQTDFRNKQQRFGIRAVDRLRHMYVIGKTGVGKSTLLENMAVQDIQNGNGLTFIDPHGKTAELLLEYIPEHRIDDVIYFAPHDMDNPISFNIMEDVGADQRHKVANGIISIMKKIWIDSFSGRMEYLLSNALLALLEYPDATMLGINRMLTDKEYRKKVVDNIKDVSVRAYWEDDYGKWDERYAREAGASVQNKIGQFSSNPIIRNIIGQPKSSFNMRVAMDNKKIIIANMSKGQLGEDNAKLIGGMFNTKMYLAAMSRANLSEAQIDILPAHYLYVDEFQNFASESFADILSEARKYKLGLVIAHQYIAQMPDSVREAIFGNVGTLVTMRIGPEDAEKFAQQFSPVFSEEDLVSLGPWQMYLSLMVGGLGSKPFSANTLLPIPKPEVNSRARVVENSRRFYSRPRVEVEKAIMEWFRPIPTKKTAEYQGYIEKKRTDLESEGKVWVDRNSFSERGNVRKPRETTGSPEKFTPSKQRESEKKQTVYTKPPQTVTPKTEVVEKKALTPVRTQRPVDSPRTIPAVSEQKKPQLPQSGGKTQREIPASFIKKEKQPLVTKYPQKQKEEMPPQHETEVSGELLGLLDALDSTESSGLKASPKIVSGAPAKKEFFQKQESQKPNNVDSKDTASRSLRTKTTITPTSEWSGDVSNAPLRANQRDVSQKSPKGKSLPVKAAVGGGASRDVSLRESQAPRRSRTFESPQTQKTRKIETPNTPKTMSLSTQKKVYVKETKESSKQALRDLLVRVRQEKKEEPVAQSPRRIPEEHQRERPLVQAPASEVSLGSLPRRGPPPVATEMRVPEKMRQAPSIDVQQEQAVQRPAGVVHGGDPVTSSFATKTADTSPLVSVYHSGKPKEVPEELLRSVLE